MIIFPLQMSIPWFRLLQIFTGYPSPYEDHVDNVAASFYVRGLAQNITMVGFLGELSCTGLGFMRHRADLVGWLTILHFGPNSRMFSLNRTAGCAADAKSGAIADIQRSTLSSALSRLQTIHILSSSPFWLPAPYG